jgi:ubiquinone/menaquinone biosynthesis C-methylase UbiE
VFGAAHADGVELFPASAAACREAVRDLGARVDVQEGDATSLPAAAASYDAVFGYHVLHHAEAWRDVVREAARVLCPGGRFYSCEMTARFVDTAPCGRCRGTPPTATGRPRTAWPRPAGLRG